MIQLIRGDFSSSIFERARKSINLWMEDAFKDRVDSLLLDDLLLLKITFLRSSEK